MIRIGANPICWSNDDMIEIGGNISLEQCLSEAREIGLEGMEKGNKFPTTAPELKAKLAEFGLVFISGWYSTFLSERDADAEFAAAQADLKLRKDAGAEVLVTCECARTVHGDQVGAAFDAAGVDRRRMGGLPAANDSLRGTRQGIRAPTRLPPSHGYGGSDAGGRRPLHGRHRTGGEAAARHWPHHLGRRRRGSRRQDLRRQDRPYSYQGRSSAIAAKALSEDWSFLDSVLAGVYTVPGDGSIDFVGVFKAVPKYSGWIVIEAGQDPEKANPKKYVTMGYKNLKRYLKEAGLN